jgi:hypothetical protein
MPELSATEYRLFQQLLRDAARRPLWVPPRQDLTLRRLKITGGKDLGYGGLQGVLCTLAAINDIAAELNRNAPAANAPDGFGWATDMHTDERVIVITARLEVEGRYIGGGVITFDLPVDTEVLSFRDIAVPIAGGGSMLAAEAWYLG